MVQKAENALRCAEPGPLLPLSVNRPRLYIGSHRRRSPTTRSPPENNYPRKVGIYIADLRNPDAQLTHCHRNQATASPLDQRTGFHTPASREQGFSPANVQDGGFDTSIDSLPDSTGLSSLQRSYASDQNGPESQQLSPNEMIAPASAVHSMSVNLLGSNDVSRTQVRLTICMNLTIPDFYRELSKRRP